MQLNKSRVGTVLAGAAILALAGGGAAAADNWYGGGDRGWDSNRHSGWEHDRGNDWDRDKWHNKDPKPAAIGLSHWSEGGTVPAMQNGLPGSIEIEADCQQEGHYAISGGYTAGTYKGGVTTYLNRNTAGAAGTDDYAKGWIVGFTNTTTTPQTVRTWVVCATAYEDEPSS